MNQHSESDSENGYDTEMQQQAELSKLQNLSSQMRQLLMYVNQYLRKTLDGSMINGAMQNFDKAIEDYNLYYLRKRMKKLTHFKINPLAVSSAETCFSIKVVSNRNQLEESGYFINLIFLKHQSNYYQMHVQIWKNNGENDFTNKIFSRFQKNCTAFLAINLQKQGFVSLIQGKEIVLQTKSPPQLSFGKGGNEQNQLIYNIKLYSEKFLNDMIILLTNEKTCNLCQKHLLYESSYHAMMPPTIIVSTSIDFITKQDKNKYLHEGCALKYLKPRYQKLRQTR